MFRHQSGNPAQTYEPRCAGLRVTRVVAAPRLPGAGCHHLARHHGRDDNVVQIRSNTPNKRSTHDQGAMRNLDMNDGGDHTYSLPRSVVRRPRSNASPRQSLVHPQWGRPDRRRMRSGRQRILHVGHRRDPTATGMALTAIHTFGRSHIGQCDQGLDDPDYPFPKGGDIGAGAEFVGLDIGDPALGLPMRALWHRVPRHHELLRAGLAVPLHLHVNILRELTMRRPASYRYRVLRTAVRRVDLRRPALLNRRNGSMS